MTAVRSLRCAIYTRKSSEEGLEQSFNSLHAQREACEAYIKSQAGEGWRLRGDHYDDGGYSGGAMDRPALRRLLGDVVARRVDVVVVYKVDRLTRYLPDFAKIIEAFDTAEVSFVSVTQAFNTTTSMGRLTLNVLLSFAQFEREVTGERIRDKIAASKAKGMWMGGLPPLGYDVPNSSVTRALVTNAAEAETVRLIFRRYLELGNLGALQMRLQEEGVHSKRWMSARRRPMGGHPFSRGALRHLLGNRTYLGVTTHKGTDHTGRHSAIVDEHTFKATQALLARNRQVRRERLPRAASALLQGRVFDGDGQPMEPVFAHGRGRLYRYYVSAPTWLGGDDAIRRVPASAVEELVLRRLAPIAGMQEDELDREAIRNLASRVEIHSAAVHLVLRTKALGARSAQRVTIESVRRQLVPGEQVTTEPHDNRLIRILLPVRLKVRGGRNWIVGPNGEVGRATPPPNTVMIKRVRAAHAVLRACGADPNAPNPQLRYAQAPKSSHKMALVHWAFLAPDIQRAILEGREVGRAPLALTGNMKIPLLWSEQRSLFAVHQPQQDVGRTTAS